jgi:hypothetical protein
MIISTGVTVPWNGKIYRLIFLRASNNWEDQCNFPRYSANSLAPENRPSFTIQGVNDDQRRSLTPFLSTGDGFRVLRNGVIKSKSNRRIVCSYEILFHFFIILPEFSIRISRNDSVQSGVLCGFRSDIQWIQISKLNVTDQPCLIAKPELIRHFIA